MRAKSGTPSRAPTETPAPARTASAQEIAAIVEGRHPDPFALLGLHEVGARR
jgi:hypothetical protein